MLESAGSLYNISDDIVSLNILNRLRGEWHCRHVGAPFEAIVSQAHCEGDFIGFYEILESKVRTSDLHVYVKQRQNARVTKSKVVLKLDCFK